MSTSKASLTLLSLVALFQCYQLVETGKADYRNFETQKGGFNTLFYGSIADNYDRINNYLVDCLPSCRDAEKNMAEAIRWLNEQKSKNSVLRNNNLIEALEQFTALTKTVTKDSCNREGHNILLANHQATRNRAYKIESCLVKTVFRQNPFGRRPVEVKIQPPRIVRTIQNYHARHAEECRQVYLKMFEAKYEELDQALLHRLRTLVDILAKPSALKSVYDKKEVELNLVSLDDIKGLDVIVTTNRVKDLIWSLSYNAEEYLKEELVYNGAKLIAEQDPSQSNTLDGPEKVKDILKSYLFDPCRYYVKHFGSNLFELSEYDEEVLSNSHKSSEAVMRYYFGMVRYRFCHALIEREKSFVDKVISVASTSKQVNG